MLDALPRYIIICVCGGFLLAWWVVWWWDAVVIDLAMLRIGVGLFTRSWRIVSEKQREVVIRVSFLNCTIIKRKLNFRPVLNV